MHSKATWPGFKLIKSRSWQYISYPWDTCSDHSAITDVYIVGQKYYAPQAWPDRGSNSRSWQYNFMSLRDLTFLIYWFLFSHVERCVKILQSLCIIYWTSSCLSGQACSPTSQASPFSFNSWDEEYFYWFSFLSSFYARYFIEQQIAFECTCLDT